MHLCPIWNIYIYSNYGMKPCDYYAKSRSSSWQTNIHLFPFLIASSKLVTANGLYTYIVILLIIYHIIFILHLLYFQLTIFTMTPLLSMCKAWTALLYQGYQEAYEKVYILMKTFQSASAQNDSQTTACRKNLFRNIFTWIWEGKMRRTRIYKLMCIWIQVPWKLDYTMLKSGEQ